jgi:hypothetical protein
MTDKIICNYFLKKTFLCKYVRMFEHEAIYIDSFAPLLIANNFLSVRNMIVINSNKTAGPAFFLIIDFKLFNKH